MSKIAAQKAIAEHLKKVEEEEGEPPSSLSFFFFSLLFKSALSICGQKKIILKNKINKE
jgi:hypothetical protein